MGVRRNEQRGRMQKTMERKDKKLRQQRKQINLLDKRVRGRMRKWRDDPNSKWTEANHYIFCIRLMRCFLSSIFSEGTPFDRWHAVPLASHWYDARGTLFVHACAHVTLVIAASAAKSSDTPWSSMRVHVSIVQKRHPNRNKKKRRVNCKTKRKKYQQGRKNKKKQQNNKTKKKGTNKTSNKGEKKETILNTTKNEEMK